ncbi:uncharacterized protein B0I36DRAFT_338910 [Microdochium trichocladiopsis]|uniref:Uncharacterized protein n=1 Tax=Microdochium trichocladiopsis TaxID=1682393 RepID=A0A9P8XSF7_9PEZI|nr:uncharacterized protein B0I36DRAFT_338910 [Microdochium trichocladiopsis]KAH7014574.1 hypothetical protein B0I36DRAFT_338910 [Microdochium trichocladiopsis]
MMRSRIAGWWTPSSQSRDLRIVADNPTPDDVAFNKDREMMKLARTVVEADALCVSLMAKGMYEIRRAGGDVLTLRSTSLDTVTEEGLYRHAIRAKELQQSPSEYCSVLEGLYSAAGHSEQRTMSVLEITEMKDDKLSLAWHGPVSQLVSDLWGFRVEGKSVSASYLKDKRFGELWDNIPFLISRSQDDYRIYQDAQKLKSAVKRAADLLEHLIKSQVREIDEGTILGICVRALAVERLWTFYNNCGNDYFTRDAHMDRWKARMERITNVGVYKNFLSSGKVHERNEQNAKISRQDTTPSVLPPSDSLARNFHQLALISGLVLLAFAAVAVKSSQQSDEPGSLEDADFWWLLCSCMSQVFSVLFLVLPLRRSIIRFRRLPARVLGLLVATSIILSATSIPTYLYATKTISSVFGLAANVVLVGLQVQVSMTALDAIGAKEKGQ